MEISLVTLLIGALATYRISRLLVEDELFRPLRERIWTRFPPESTKIGYIFTCYHCSSVWAAAILVPLLLWGGIIGFTVALILALSATAGLISTLLER